MVSDKGGRFGFVYRTRQRVYKALRRQGKSKTVAAKISNAGRFHPGAEECIRRAGLDDRPEHTVGEIHKWYRLFRPSPVDWPPPVLRATSAGPATSRQW